MRTVLILCTVLGVSACVPAQPPLADRVAVGVRSYGIYVAPDSLSLDQAAAMSITLDKAHRESYFDTRRRLKAILRNPDFQD